MAINLACSVEWHTKHVARDLVQQSQKGDTKLNEETQQTAGVEGPTARKRGSPKASTEGSPRARESLTGRHKKSDNRPAPC